MLTPLTLSGSHIRLDPLSLDHVAGLAEVGLVPELWRLQPAPIETVADMRRYVESALADQSRGVSLPFAIIEQKSGRVIGSTRYMDVALEHQRLEIGATWLAPQWQRTAANSEAKLLLLTHAFEVLGINRVVLKTETLNTQSRKAILRLGAREEGVFRQHLIADSGRKRDMVYFALLAEDWPVVKERLAGWVRR